MPNLPSTLFQPDDRPLEGEDRGAAVKSFSSRFSSPTPTTVTEVDKVPKDFWVIAAIDYDKDNGWILRTSEDVAKYDVIDGPSLDDNGLTRGNWFSDAVVGLYFLRLKPWSSGPGYDGEWDAGIDVTEARLILPFPEEDSLIAKPMGEKPTEERP